MGCTHGTSKAVAPEQTSADSMSPRGSECPMLRPTLLRAVSGMSVLSSSGRKRGSLRKLPKGHLHYNLEACMRRSSFFELCEKHDVEFHSQLPEGSHHYTTFKEFQSVLESVTRPVLQAPEDLERIINEMAEDAVDQCVVYIEPCLGMAKFLAKTWDMTERQVWDAAVGWGRAAEERTGVVIRWMSSAVRVLPPDQAVELARFTVQMLRDGLPIVSFGLHAAEGELGDDSGPFPPEPFAEAFSIASEAGLIITPHAGEHLGAGSCQSAVEHLGAHRLQHGVRAVEDESTLQLLREWNICCDICPTSNVRLGVQGAPDLAHHPLPVLLAAGVPCSIGVDDSLLFDVTIMDEYKNCRDHMGLSDRAMRSIARNSLVYSSLMLRVEQGCEDAGAVKLLEQLRAVAHWGYETISSL